MAGIEGERPQSREAAFDAGKPGGTAPGGERYERSEIHYDDEYKSLWRREGLSVKVQLENGKPVAVTHLYVEAKGKQVCWWTEREQVAVWQESLRKAHEKGDPAYKDISEYHVPSVVTHTYVDRLDMGGRHITPHVVTHYPSAQAASLGQMGETLPRQAQEGDQDSDQGYYYSPLVRDLLADAGHSFASLIRGIQETSQECAVKDEQEAKTRLEQEHTANQPDRHVEFLIWLRQRGKLES